MVGEDATEEVPGAFRPSGLLAPSGPAANTITGFAEAARVGAATNFHETLIHR